MSQSSDGQLVSRATCGAIVNVDEDGVDVELRPGVILELCWSEQRDRLEVWAIRIDGVLYREPRDLTGEPLPAESPFVVAIKDAVGAWLAQRWVMRVTPASDEERCTARGVGVVPAPRCERETHGGRLHSSGGTWWFGDAS